MAKEFIARRLDVRRFAEEAGALEGREPVQKHERLMAETQGRGGAYAVSWSAAGEMRNPGHVHPEVWVHLRAQAVLPLTCQRCLGPVEVPLAVDRSFRFVADEDMAAAQDETAEEDVLALSRSFDLVELVEDELLMELPLAPRHEVCPQPVKLSVADPDFDEAGGKRESAFGVLGKLKTGKPEDK
ncbi:DUF177 domain-containing protein [Ramlibacter sp.]|uniref:YceD family protein n=1 Tax=Ramlibacter sp. TaxID=1917967 RepID=UPI002C289A26|nr:DUF177 domain-containing protein [Ramlibacter sp.]HWI81091.1 DUF177 domain-containing protein [Ramlibacter sp.]